MPLPEQLQMAIDQAIESSGLKSLIAAREELTERYRQHVSDGPLITTDAQRLAYVAARMPATYAAVAAVCQAVRERTPGLEINSMLDLGAGPGTAMWAVCDYFEEVERVTLIERDRPLLDLGRRFAQASERKALFSADWQQADLEQLTTLPPHDLIILSYSAGELRPEAMERLLELCWARVGKLLVVIEPGTPVGFERIRTMRRRLIERQAYLVAPCPHSLTCPMAGADWCHFAAHVERSSVHRRLKGGSLGHEDEKFAYIAVTKQPWAYPSARILRHPLRHSGHIELKLCTSEGGVRQQTLSKKLGEVYKQARKKEWGDYFDGFNLSKVK